MQTATSTPSRENRISFPFGLSLSVEHLWLATPVFVLAWKSFSFPLPALDFWWHLKMGQVLATTRSLPHVDLFSFTASGHTFVAQNWLAELIYYGTFLLGGLPLLVVLHPSFPLSASLPLYALCRKATGSVRPAALIGLAMAVGFVCNVRPQVFSFVMFALYYWILDRYRSRRKDGLWALPALMVLWVNLHGAFV